MAILLNSMFGLSSWGGRAIPIWTQNPGLILCSLLGVSIYNLAIDAWNALGNIFKGNKSQTLFSQQGGGRANYPRSPKWQVILNTNSYSLLILNLTVAMQFRQFGSIVYRIHILLISLLLPMTNKGYQAIRIIDMMAPVLLMYSNLFPKYFTDSTGWGILTPSDTCITS